MATTEQRSGFRLPWASDARSGAPAADDAPAADPAQPGDAAAIAEAQAAQAAPEATSIADPESPDPRDPPWPGTDAPADLTGADPAAVAAAVEAPAQAAPPAVPTARSRRDNPLVAGLVQAMRVAAGAARQESAARFAEQAKARVEAIHSTSADEAASLRKEADAEIVAIRDWSKAEVARIREETEGRIAARRRRLEADVDAHAARVEHRIEIVQAASRQFETRLDAFYEELLAEEDPARLAGLAEQLPEPPALDLDDGWPATGSWAALDAGGAAAAEAEAFAEADPSEFEGSELEASELEASELEASGDGPADDALLGRLAALAAPPEAAREAATTRLSVAGLVSVASIAGFKRALARTPGVRSVTVASGPAGDFVFSVAHDPETDLRSAIPAIPRFRAVIGGDVGGVVAVTATDPESDQ
jgi:hypothetical protein